MMLWVFSRRPHQRGFTLIELIMVIVILGVLAVFASPRIFNSNDFNARGFHDETLAMLRYAQKAAIAQRTMVTATFDIAAVPPTLTLKAYDKGTSTYVNLAGPKGQNSVLTAPAGVTYNGTPTSFNFDGLGQPVNAAGALVASQIIQVSNAAKAITVETVTGYVHE